MVNRPLIPAREIPKRSPSGFRSNGHKGARGELIAAAHFLAKGYEVFRNIASHGPADLLAWDISSDEVLKIDVKSMAEYQLADGSVRKASVMGRESKHPAVRLLFVDVDGAVIADDQHAPSFKGNPARDWLFV